MWQAFPMVMDFMDKRRAAEEQRKQQAALMLQQSAQRLGAPSTAEVTAAMAEREGRQDSRGQFADLMMQIGGQQPMGAPQGDRGKLARMLMQFANRSGGG